MARYGIRLAIVLAVSLAPFIGRAQERIPSVGIVANTIPLEQWSGPSLEDGTPHGGYAIRQGLEKLGWIDGRNLRIVWRSAEGKYDRLPGIFSELAAMPVDAIVAIGPGTTAAMKATREVPVVFVVSAATLGPWVSSLSRPDRNLTGLSVEAEGQEGKRLELLKRAIPTATRVALLEERSGCAPASQVLKDAARSLGLTLLPVGFETIDQLDRALRDVAALRPDAMLVCDAVWVWRFGVQRKINAAGLRHRIPIMHTAAGGADTGGLMSYGIDQMIQYRRVPYYLDRLLRGAKPRDLPIEQPAALEFVINLRTAREIGVTVPAALLVQASRVID
jgi:putative ABC transport system substrate-binding protein